MFGLEKILGNKSVMNLALGGIRKDMAEKGITAIVITHSGNEEGDTPGLDIKPYTGNVVLVTGEEAEMLATGGRVITEEQWSEYLYLRTLPAAKHYRGETVSEVYDSNTGEVAND